MQIWADMICPNTGSDFKIKMDINLKYFPPIGKLNDNFFVKISKAFFEIFLEVNNIVSLY